MRSTAILSIIAGAAIAAPAVAQPLAVGVRTIFLERGPGAGSTPAAVAYHPGFSRYYASNAGNATFGAWVYDAAGNRIQNLAELGIDARGWNYNPNTNKLEVTTFSAASNGLREAMTDGSGNLTGGTATLLATISGIAGSQSMPAYDPDADVLYSRETSATVNVCRRSDGTLASTFNLDVASAGIPASNIAFYATGYDPDSEWVIVVDSVNDTAVVFSTTGAYIGTSKLDIDVQSSFRMGFANGQVFVFDNPRNGWQGYDIGSGGGCYPDCEEDGDLDVFDFLCFQGEYANQTEYADCENDNDWDVFDFLCFQGQFANGCN